MAGLCFTEQVRGQNSLGQGNVEMAHEALGRLAEMLRCTVCGAEGLLVSQGVIRCRCGRLIPVRGFLIDMMDEEQCRVTMTFGQAAMRWKPLVAVYNGLWRHMTFPFATWIPFSTEQEIILGYHGFCPQYRLLDIACGPGTYTRRYAEAIGSEGIVVGVDASGEMLEQAAQVAARKALHTMWLIKADASKIPFRDNMFDGVNCTGALHLFDHIDPVLERIHAVLKPQGVFTLMTFCKSRSSTVNKVAELLGIHLVDRVKLEESLCKAGLTIRDVRSSRRMLLVCAHK